MIINIDVIRFYTNPIIGKDDFFFTLGEYGLKVLQIKEIDEKGSATVEVLGQCPKNPSLN